MEIKVVKREEIKGVEENTIFVFFDRGTFVVSVGTSPFVSLGEFKQQVNAEIFARAYADAKTMVTFGEILKEVINNTDEIPKYYKEWHKQKVAEAMKKYKELRPLENAGKADLAQIIASANVFQRKLNRFIHNNIHFLE